MFYFESKDAAAESNKRFVEKKVITAQRKYCKIESMEKIFIQKEVSSQPVTSYFHLPGGTAAQQSGVKTWKIKCSF